MSVINNELTCLALTGCVPPNARRRSASCVVEGVQSDATQLNSTLSWVELSCVTIDGALLWLAVAHSPSWLKTPTVRLQAGLIEFTSSMPLLWTFCMTDIPCHFRDSYLAFKQPHICRSLFTTRISVASFCWRLLGAESLQKNCQTDDKNGN